MTDVVAWASQIEGEGIRNARKRVARTKVVVDQEVLEAVAQTAESLSGELDARHEAVEHCLRRLPSRDRELVLTRYEAGGTVEEAARKSGRSLEAAYKALSRIRKLLLDCVTHQLEVASSAVK